MSLSTSPSHLDLLKGFLKRFCIHNYHWDPLASLDGWCILCCVAHDKHLQRATIYSCSTNAISLHSHHVTSSFFIISVLCLVKFLALKIFLAFFYCSSSTLSLWLIAQCSFIDCIHSPRLSCTLQT